MLDTFKKQRFESRVKGLVFIINVKLKEQNILARAVAKPIMPGQNASIYFVSGPNPPSKEVLNAIVKDAKALLRSLCTPSHFAPSEIAGPEPVIPTPAAPAVPGYQSRKKPKLS